MTSGLTNPSVTSFTVGITTPVNLGMVPQGSTIINTDTTNPVYVSSSSSVSAGTGIRIGPLGTLTWTDTTLVWCIASGAPVTVQVSSLIVDPVNPVDTAEAVAALLAVTGVPSKLLITNIGTWTVSGTEFNIPADLTAYQSIYLVITDIAGTHALQYQWYDGTDNVGSVQAIYPQPSSNMESVLTVLGPTLTFFPYPGESWRVTAYGYNRQIPALQPAWGAVWTGTATPSNTTVALNLTSGTIPSTGLCGCYLQCYPLPSGLNRVQVQAADSTGYGAPTLILNDYTLPAAGTGIFLSFQAVLPPADNYAPVIRLFSSLTANCSLILHTVQSQW